VEPSPAPWRAFEAPDPGGAPASGGTAAAPSTSESPIPRAVTIAAVGLMLALVVGAAVLAVSGRDAGAVVVAPTGSGRPGATGPVSVLIVDVGGAVARPGVYRLPSGARVGDAIAAAGGYGPRVDAERAARELNLAETVADGDHVLVPSRDAVDAGGPDTAATSKPGAASDALDLNRATEAELEALPGIGPATAQKIVASRETSPFATVQDLRDRKLVGQKVFDGLSALVTVR
jgi:competence protein ComEA